MKFPCVINVYQFKNKKFKSTELITIIMNSILAAYFERMK
jgi:hypothetical protein